MSEKSSRFVIGSSVAALALAIGLTAGQLSGAPASHATPQPTPVASRTAQPAPLVRGLPDFTALVEQVGPAVVNISTTQPARSRDEDALPFRPGDPFYEFFRRFGPPQGQERPRPAQGIGSGFIISADGFVLTNAHVVADANEVNVKLTDKREFKARVVGSDRRTDVALLKIDATGLPFVRTGDAGKVKVGEWVVAVGSPFGFENTVTAGIVSAKSRNLPDETYVPFLQTDVAINPGNSGGPLFNLYGEVVGINSQIYSRTGGFMGLSFAIPIDVAMTVKEQLREHGKVSRGKLGVVIQPVTKELAQSFGTVESGGALVASVQEDSPAARAGIQSGDIILDANGTRIEQSTDLPRLIGNMRPGETAKLRVWRQGEERSVAVKLAELAPEPIAAAEVKPEKTETPRLGVAVRPLTASEAKELGVDGGVRVERAEGAAARAGIAPGDTILALNGKPVRNVDDFRKLIEGAGERVAALVQRGENRLYVPIRIG
jgi:serine protease Do